MCFATLWLIVTTTLAVLSGWFRLMARFPDQIEEPLLQIRRQSGSMGFGVNMRGILNLSVCPSGLRVGLMRMFGPFSRNFFVPWGDISVVRKQALFSPTAKLQFGNPVIGNLTLPARVADRLARAAMKRWPEAGPFPEERHGDTLRRLLVQWVVMSVAAALFFGIVPLFVVPAHTRPPIALAILFPAIAFGMMAIVTYVRERN
jgi:hypothetical protein